MGISYSYYIGYGFPINKLINEDDDSELYNALYEEGLKVGLYGSSWSGKLYSFIASDLKEVGNEEYLMKVDEVKDKLWTKEKLSKDEVLINLYERAKEFGVNESKIGWYFLVWKS